MSVSRSISVVFAGLAAVAIGAVVFSGPIAHRLHGHSGTHEVSEAIQVSSVAGFTKVGFTADYMVVVNVLAGEEMFSVQEVFDEYPTVGEMEMGGEGSEVVTDARHVEAHIYDRDTGAPVTEPAPVIQVVNGTTGAVTLINSVLMQDVIVGETDIHFGDNFVIAGDTDLKIRVSLGNGEEVVVDGYLN